MLTKVLHVDDEEDVRRIVELALGQIGGLDLCICSNGEEVLAEAAQFKPDLFLIDSMMPDMSGEETVRRLRDFAEFDDTPVVFLTAVGHREAHRQLETLNPAAILLKPFDPITLHEQLEAIWQDSNAGRV